MVAVDEFLVELLYLEALLERRSEVSLGLEVAHRVKLGIAFTEYIHEST